jgi:CRP-like cAMP-binding protein
VPFFDYVPGDGLGDSLDPPFLESAGDTEWALLRPFCDIRKYPDGALISKAGSADRSIYLVLGGSVALRAAGRAGRRGEAVCQTREVIGEVAFFDGVPRTTDFLALGECEILLLSFENFGKLAALEPALGHRLLLELGRALAHRLRVAKALIGSGP